MELIISWWRQWLNNLLLQWESLHFYLFTWTTSLFPLVLLFNLLPFWIQVRSTVGSRLWQRRLRQKSWWCKITVRALACSAAKNTPKCKSGSVFLKSGRDCCFLFPCLLAHPYCQASVWSWRSWIQLQLLRKRQKKRLKLMLCVECNGQATSMEGVIPAWNSGRKLVWDEEWRMCRREAEEGH